MLLLIVACCILFIVIEYVLRKSIWSPMGVYNMTWGLISILSSFGLFGSTVPSIKVYTLVFISVLCFNVGVILFGIIDDKVKANRSLSIGVKHATGGIGARSVQVKVQDTPFLLASIVVFVLFLKYAISGYYFIQMYGLAGLRNTLLTDREQIAAGAQYVAAIWFGEPIMMACFLRIAADIENIGKHIPLLLISVLNLACVFLTTAGRSMVVFCLLFLAIGLAMEYKNDVARMVKKQKLLLAICFFGAVLTLYITQKRSITQSGSFFENAYFYCVGSLSYMGILLETYEPRYMLFRNLFEALVEPVIAFVSKVAGFDYTSSHTLIAEATQVYQKVSNTVSMNNNCTMVFTAYYDMGNIGVVVYSLIFGALIAYSAKMDNRNSEFRKCIKIYAYLLVIFSSFEWILGRVSYAYVYIILIILYRREFIAQRHGIWEETR